MVRLRRRHDAADGAFGLHCRQAAVSRHAGGALELANGNGYRSGGGCPEISRHAGNHPRPGNGMPVNPRAPATRGAASPRGSEVMVPRTGGKQGGKKGAVVPRPDHVVVVILENEHRSSVMGSRHAPYLNKLAARGANLTQSFGVTHPSQPNYLALFSGSTHGVKATPPLGFGKPTTSAISFEALD